jgi:1-acyl-sn-glycerol-3-phosphate acyltransferase
MMVTLDRIRHILRRLVITWIVGLFGGTPLASVARLSDQVEVRGGCHLHQPGGYALAGNHKSIWEVFLIPLLLFPHYLFDFRKVVRNVAAVENFSNRWWWKWAEEIIIFISRPNKKNGRKAAEQAIEAIRKMAEVVRAGAILLVFPESGRTWSIKQGEAYRYSRRRGCRIRPFKCGGLVRVLESLGGQSLTVIPFWVERPEDTRPDVKGWVDSWKPMKFVFGKPIVFQPGTTEQEMARALEDAVLALADTLELNHA